MNQLFEDLKAARELIAKGWTQSMSARDVSGEPVRPTSPRAVCFCTLGALNRATDDELARSDNCMRLLRIAIGCLFIHEWNDAHGRTQEEVLAAFDKAIAACEGAKS